MMATTLLAEAHDTPNAGGETCFYCGDIAGADSPLALSTSFVDWWSVARPDSGVVCRGCALALREKIAIDGKDKPQKTRNYSWFVTRREAVPLTKADKRRITEILARPPAEPWALALADSGQKHLLWRTPVNFGGPAPWTVQLEETTLCYVPEALMERCRTARSVVAAVGHPGAAAAATATSLVRVFDEGGDAGLAAWEAWLGVRHEPLSRLALFLTPSREECRRDDDRDV